MPWPAELNFHRAAAAGIAAAETCQRALRELQCTPRQRQVAETRAAHPVESWSDIGDRLGLTKFQASSAYWNLRRALHRRSNHQEAQ